MAAARTCTVLMMVLASTGCRHLLGIDDPSTPPDASIDADLVDGPPVDVLVDGPPGTTTLRFRQNVDGYTRVVDTYIDGGSPNATRDANTDLRWRPEQRYALIRFDGLFGATSATIPQLAEIISATLTLNLSNDCNAAGRLSEVAVSWNADVTFNTFGPGAGVDLGDLGPVVGNAPFVVGTGAIDVTASIARWANNETNDGWIIVGDSGAGAGDCVARSSEDGVVANRPQLTVTFR